MAQMRNAAVMPIIVDMDRDLQWLQDRSTINETGCWVWNRFTTKTGYGRFNMNSKVINAHRFAYEMLVGDIPEGLEIDHLCRVRACVNPDHMEPVTHAENMARGVWPRKSHCVNGHALTDDNIEINAQGNRCCVTCRRYLGKIRSQKRRDRLKEAG